MKTETQVKIKLGEIKAGQHLHLEQDGFIIKVFFACSRKDTKVFKISGLTTNIDQALNISNISGKQLQFWLCTFHNKIIANATVPLPEQLQTSHEVSVDFKMTTTAFALVNMTLTVSKRQIQKPIFVQPDEELLKKVEDPYQKQRKQQEQVKKQKQLEEQQNAARQVKKAAITVTYFNKKDVPFV